MTLSRWPLWVSLVLGLVTSGCTATSPSDAGLTLQPLGASEIRQTLAGNTLSRNGRELWRNWTYAGFHRDEGIISGRVWWPGGRELAQGTWEVTQQDLYCRTWQNQWGNGQRGCFRVSRDGDILVFDHVSGSRGDADRYVYRLLSGNPHGL